MPLSTRNGQKPTLKNLEIMRFVQLRSVLLVSAVALSTAFTGVNTVDYAAVTAIDIKDTVKKSFKVDRDGTLEIEADRGNVEVKTIRGDVVNITVDRYVSVERREDAKEILEMHKLEMARKGSTVLVSSRVDERRFKWRSWKGDDRLRVEVTVEVPEDFEVEVVTGAGNVAVAGVGGTVDVRSGAGSIEIRNVGDEVEVVSGSGDVKLENVAGPVDVHTGAGNITVRSAGDALSAATGAGNVIAYIVDQPSEDSRLVSGAGNVTVYLSEDVGVSVEALAFGNCTTDFPLKAGGKWMTKSLSGDLNGGGPDLAMKSSVGNVTLKRLRR